MWYKINKIYVWDKQVRPKTWGGGFTPTVNTVAYYPLTSSTTVSDLSWNNHNLTNNSNLVTFWTNAWVDCANFWTPWRSSHNLYYTNPTFLPSWNASRTMSIWAYNTRTSTHDSLMCFWGAWSSKNLWGFFYNSWVYIAWYSADTSQYNFTQNVWHNVIWTFDGSVIRLYLDWALQGTKSTSLNTTTGKFWIGWGSTSSAFSSDHYRDWYLSECIVENVTRTATEISDYYNSTKSKYWL